MEKDEFTKRIRLFIHDKFVMAGKPAPVKVGMSKANYDILIANCGMTEENSKQLLGVEIYVGKELPDDMFMYHFLSETLLINSTSGKAINMPMVHAAFTLNPKYYEN